MDKPLLTIAIPTYNRAGLLNKCLESVVLQLSGAMWNDIELIVSDNASADGTTAVVQRFIDNGIAISYYRNDQNLGPDRNIANCFLKAGGKYVWVFSDDDFILPGYLPLIISLLKNTEVGVIYVNSLWYSNKFDQQIQIPSALDYTTFPDVIAYAEKINFWCTFLTGSIINKSALKDTSHVAAYYDTYMVQLSWSLPVMFSGADNIVINDKVIACMANNTGGYRLFEVFGQNVGAVISRLAAKGWVDPRMRKIVGKHLLNTFFPNFIYNIKPVFAKEKPLVLMTRNFWTYPAFWTKIFPVLFKNEFLKMRRLKKLIAKAVYGVVNSGYYREIDEQRKAAARTNLGFKTMGEGSFLPEQCLIKNPQHISIGKNFCSLYNLRLEAWDEYGDQSFTPELIIGDNVNMNTDVHIGCINKVLIGNNVLIASRVYISDHAHGDTAVATLQIPPVKRPLVTKGEVIIEDNVWIGEGVCILPNVTIGKGSIVGANAVVTKSFPANSIIAGVPAQLIKAV